MQGNGTISNKFVVQLFGGSLAGARRSAALLQRADGSGTGTRRTGTSRDGAQQCGGARVVHWGHDGRKRGAEVGAMPLLRIFRTWPRGTAAVSTGRRSLARVVFTAPDTDSEFQWHMPATEAFGLEKEAIAALWPPSRHPHRRKMSIGPPSGGCAQSGRDAPGGGVERPSVAREEPWGASAEGL